MGTDSTFVEALTDRGECPICGSLVWSTRLAFAPIPVVRCTNCSMMFSSQILEPSALADYYTSEFGSERHRQGQMMNARLNLRVVQRLAGARLEGGARVLDVGTGYGFLLKEMRDRYGASVAGAELSEQEATYARTQLGLDVHVGALASTGFGKADFDLVCAFEVMEHIVEPRAFIAELTEYVRPGGLVIIGTDNFDAVIVRRLGAAFPKWIPHTHVSHFNGRTLERLISSTPELQLGDEWSYDGWEFYARAAVTRRGHRTNAEEWFDLKETLATEMGGTFKFFELRRFFNPWWVMNTGWPDLRGAMMYATGVRHARV